MKTRSSFLSLLIVLSLLLSAITPALAQDQWPSTRDGAGTTAVAPSPGQPQPTLPGHRAVSPELAQQAIEQFRAAQAAGDPRAQLPGARRLESTTARTNRDASVSATVRAMEAQGSTPVRAIVSLKMPSLAQVGANMTPDQRAAYAAQVAQQQAVVAAQVEATGGKVLARFSTLSSGLAVTMPGNRARSVAALPQVARISPVHDYEKDLSETVPFIGAKDVQDLGVTGNGVKVAVLDSGVDFTHLAFGGPGTLAAYEAAYFGAVCPDFADSTCANARVANPALFGPNAPKVKGGWDWVGEAWPDEDEAPDPNPIDAPAEPLPFDGGHGTHVSDIVAGLGYPAGENEDGPYVGNGPGVAPGADLWVFKVCSSISTSCSGLALLAAMDDAADLDNNPQTKDPADVINMSLGSYYGQPEDDLTAFSNEAVSYGVIVVASAGNDADKPFIVGSPSMGDGVISVAQTAVPSSKRYPLSYETAEIEGEITDGVWQNWSVPLEVSGAVSGTLVYGNADGSNKNGCAPYTDYMTGTVILADRGVCNFTLKAVNATAAGAVLSIIGLVAPGAPFEGGDGGQRPIDIPSFMIDQADSTVLKSLLADGVVVGADPTNYISMAYTVVGSSARGPRNHDNRIKPDIGAPGASVSAITATGAEIGPFGGTSGAAPMVSGVAALMKEVWGDTLIPQQYKALLMNYADTDIWIDREDGDYVAPITRVGGGQVQAAWAYRGRIIVWDSTETDDPLKWTGSMSFGYVPVSDYVAITRTLSIKNFGALGQTVFIDSFYRASEDFRQGVFVTPGAFEVFIPAGATVEVPVVFEAYAGGIDDFLDPVEPWDIDKGFLGVDGNALTYQEYDGWVVLTPQAGGGLNVTVPWQILPKAAADTSVGLGVAGAPGFGALVNASPAVTGTSEGFALMAVTENSGHVVGSCASLGLPPGCNEAAVDINEVGVRGYPAVDPEWLDFAITANDTPYFAGQFPVEFDIYIDVDMDGIDDYNIFNYDLSLSCNPSCDGRNVVFFYDIALDELSVASFVDSSFNTQNWILSVPMDWMGIAPGQQFGFYVLAYDSYWGGFPWDWAPDVGYFYYTPGEARFALDAPFGQYEVPADGSTNFAWASSPAADVASPSQIGLLFLHRLAHVGRESDHVILADPFYPAQSLTLSADPQPAPFGVDVTVTALVTDTEGPLADHQVFFSPDQIVLTATLTGTQEVGPVETVASGQATFTVTLSSATIEYMLDFTGIETPTMAHVHRGGAGTNGGVIQWLWDANGANATSALPATGTFTMTAQNLTSLLQEGTYVNVHSAAHPAGEIRGQIVGAPSAFTDADGKATIVVPGAVLAQLRANRAVAVFPYYAFTGDLMAQIMIEYQSAFVAAVAVTADPTTAMATESVTVTADVTDSFGLPMAGQTVYFSDGKFRADLTGANEVPPNASTATGSAEFTIDFATGVGSYLLSFTGVETPTMAHIHLGAAGVNGPPIVWLYDATGVNATDQLPATGVFTLTQEQMMQIIQGGALFQEGLYVNVHSQAIGAGEIRGQITGAKMAVTDADGAASVPWTSPTPGTVTVTAFVGVGSVAPPSSGAVQVEFTAPPLAPSLFLPLIGGQ